MNLQKLKTKEKKLRDKQKNRYTDSRQDKIQKIHKKRMKGIVKNSTVLYSISRVPTYAAILLAMMVAIDRFEENVKKNHALKGK
jgi:hypothetical protein